LPEPAVIAWLPKGDGDEQPPAGGEHPAQLDQRLQVAFGFLAALDAPFRVVPPDMLQRRNAGDQIEIFVRIRQRAHVCPGHGHPRDRPVEKVDAVELGDSGGGQMPDVLRDRKGRPNVEDPPCAAEA